MNKLSNSILKIIVLILLLVSSISTVHALGLGSLLGGLGGGDPVNIVSDTSTVGTTNVLKNTLTTVATAATAAVQKALELKELTLDGIAWSMSKQLQQQLTADMLKWVNSGGEGGQPSFIQNYSNYYEKIADEVAGEFLSVVSTENFCNEKKKFQTQALQTSNYIKSYKQTTYQCTVEGEGAEDRNPLSMIFENVTNCTNDPYCDFLQKEAELYGRIIDAQLNEKQVLDYTRGFVPTRECSDIATADGSTRRDCKILTPPSLVPDSVSFSLGELPLQQLLNTDEFNEVVSGFMSGLTNQAITGVTGLLGLGGNDEYSNNVFEVNGKLNLSYLDALTQDDVSNYQTYNANPIKDALAAEIRYIELEQYILNTITELEAKLASNKAEFPGCFDKALSPELVTVKANTILELANANTSKAILEEFDKLFDNAVDSAYRNAVITEFVKYQNEGIFRTDYQNQELELSYINLEFNELADTFRYDTAVARVDCGGDFDFVVEGSATTTADGS